MESLYGLLEAQQSYKEGPLSLPFMGNILDRLAERAFYYFLDGYSR